MNLKNPKTMMRIGMSSLLLASLARWFVHPTAALSANWIDGGTGFLYGVSIASMLVSLRMRSHPGSRNEAGPHS
jgi:hypothetical protein